MILVDAATISSSDKAGQLQSVLFLKETVGM